MVMPLRSELLPKVPVIMSITEKLSEEISDYLEQHFPDVAYTFLYEKDDPSFTKSDGDKAVVITYPVVAMYDPDLIPFPLIQQQHKIHRDIDETTLTAKEFAPPLPVKLRYAFRTTCEDPDNDARLQMFFSRMTNLLLMVYPDLDADGNFVQNVPLYWHPPQRFRFDENVTTRIYMVDAWTNIEHMEFEKRNLVSPASPIGLTTQLMTLEAQRGIKETLARTAEPGDLEVYVVGHTKDFPMTGTIAFSRNGETFTYTSRRPNRFIGTDPVEAYHFPGELLTLQT